MSGSMRWLVGSFLFVLAAGATVPATATTFYCPDCHLGVYDDAQMTRNTGTIFPFQVKSIYLGIRMPAGVGITSLSFSASYPDGFLVMDYYSYVDGATIYPGDSGVTVQWSECLRGSQLLFRARLMTFGLVRDAVLQLGDAVGTSCDGLRDDRWLIPAGCYVANPTGGMGCAVGVRAATWAQMKELFK